MSQLKANVYDFAYGVDDPRFRGVYPSTDLQEVEPETSWNQQEENHECPKNKNGVLGRALALYDFEAASQYELSFSKGDFLILTKKQEDGWLIGYKGDEVGLVPENYIQML
ncbi:Shk1 kinase-binding protein 5 [Smittium mucronatum]|uniref:Shk1 kinase-binding protein 5 n=1 Tax=Smittium mucronatum TaxID=133383 RepID=A0A1R0GVU6_9FUNG|nr:Shk1 kinase-binding protein 5 [Smittium mucronatum]